MERRDVEAREGRAIEEQTLVRWHRRLLRHAPAANDEQAAVMFDTPTEDVESGVGCGIGIMLGPRAG